MGTSYMGTDSSREFEATRMRFKIGILVCMLYAVFCTPLWAQERTGISGVVVDGDTGETLPFVQIYFLKPTDNKGVVPSDIGTTSDIDGNFSISNTSGYTTLHFQMVGYKTEMLTLRKGQNRTNVKVKLSPDVYGLQDIVVTPKNRKRDYRRRGNPAVELIYGTELQPYVFRVG